MLEPLSNQMCDIIANYRVIEQACKQAGVTVTEIETSLASETCLPSLDVAAARSAICGIMNQRNLRQVARNTNMPAAIYLELQKAIETTGAAGARHREQRIYSTEEWAERGSRTRQPGLFDEVETLPELANIDVRDDGGNYPLG